VFTVLSILIVLIGLVSGVFYYILWVSPSVQENLEKRVGEIYGTQFWLYALIVLGVECVLFLIAYLFSLDSQRQRRPYLRLYLGGFALAFPSLALYSGSLGDTLSRPLSIAGLAVATLLIPCGIFLIEWLVAHLFIFLGRVAFSLHLWGISQRLSRVVLCILLHNVEARKLHALTLFQKKLYDQAESILYPLYSSGEDTSLELLQTLLHIYEEKNNKKRMAELLEILHSRQPDEDKWRVQLINCLEELGEHQRTAELLEEKPEYQNLNFVVRLERIYAEIEPRKAKSLCTLMAELEGEPYPQSLMAYRQLLQKLPDDIELLESMVSICLKANYTDEACEYMERILGLNPERLDIREKLIALYRERLNYPKLRKHLEEMIAQSTNVSADLMADYIDTLIHSESPEKAISYLQQAKETFPVDYRFPRMLAEIYYEQKQYDRALAEMTKALALAPEEKKGELSVLKHKIQGALLNIELAEVQKQVEASPDDIELRFKYIEKLTANAYVEKAAAELDQLLYFRPEAKESAMKHLTKLCETYERTFLLLNYLADLYLKDMNLDKVLDLYKIMANQSLHPDNILMEGCRKILVVDETYEPAVRLLAEIHYKNKNWAEAAQMFQRCLELSPSSEAGEIYRYLVEIYWEQNEFEKVCEIAPLAIKADPYNVALYKRLARALIRCERFSEAMNWLIEARNIDTHDQEIFKLIRETDTNIKKERLLELKELVQNYPDNTQYHFELAELCLAFDRLNEAILHFQKAAQQPLLFNISKVKLALCLAKKGMFDLAEETLAEVNLSLKNEEEFREIKGVIYDIAGEFEKEKLKDKALKYYKEVFRLDAGFRNVVEKIERLQSSTPWRRTR
ncbi:tetratricopeptide repeat protein, partial [Candidatus Sumerlaeota bacterium]|nr:tetratricopeptide repeat protein [Candidatus Sumerlaeota bacterium]